MRSFIRSNRLSFVKIRTFSQAPQVLMRCRKKISQKKFTEANFSKLVSYLLYTYLKKSTQKIMSEIYFVGKTRYEDLTETGS